MYDSYELITLMAIIHVLIYNHIGTNITLILPKKTFKHTEALKTLRPVTCPDHILVKGTGKNGQ